MYGKDVFNCENWEEMDMDSTDMEIPKNPFNIVLKSKNDGKLILITTLHYNKLDKLSNFENAAKNLAYHLKIAIYYGKLEKDVKDYAEKYNILLLKRLIILHDNIETKISAKGIMMIEERKYL